MTEAGVRQQHYPATVKELHLDPVRVLQKVADGLTLKDVAEDLGVSYMALKMRMSKYYDTTGCTGLVHAVVQAMRQGVVN